MLPTQQSPDEESAGGADGVMSVLTRFAPIAVIIIIVIGTIWYAVRTEPEYQTVADSFQTARRAEAWEEAMEYFAEDYQFAGGDEHVVRSSLHGGLARAEFHMSGNRPHPSMARASEGLAVVQMNEPGHQLCLRQEDGEWKVRPSPFLEYYLRHEEFMPLEHEREPVVEGRLLIAPQMPGPTEGQARIYVEPVWVRSTPQGEGMRILLSVQVSGVNLQAQMDSILTTAAWSTGDDEVNYADRLLWSNIFPDRHGAWPLEEGTWWVDIEWDEAPRDEFSLTMGNFVSGSEQNVVVLDELRPPEDYTGSGQ